MTSTYLQHTEANDGPRGIEQAAENRKARLARIAAGKPFASDVAVEARYQARLAEKAAKTTPAAQWDTLTAAQKLGAEPTAGNEIKGKRDRFVLATATEMAEFELNGETVTVTKRSRFSHFLDKVVLSLDHARGECRRLLNANYYAW